MLFVLVHGAWHSGDHLSEAADVIRAQGHVVHTPTLKGNGPGDVKSATLTDAIEGLTDYFAKHGLSDAILYAHSYGGMPVTAAADRLPSGVIRRLVYQNAFVPNHGQSLEDLNPPAFNALFTAIKQPDGGLRLPFEIWREALMNDGDYALAERTHKLLNDHPHSTMTERIQLDRNPSDLAIPKSYIDARDDLTRGVVGGWMDFANKLGLHRYMSMPGGHEVMFTAPQVLAEMIMRAGAD